MKGSPLHLEIGVPPVSEDWAGLGSGHSPLQENRQHPAHSASCCTCAHPDRVECYCDESL